MCLEYLKYKETSTADLFAGKLQQNKIHNVLTH